VNFVFVISMLEKDYEERFTDILYFAYFLDILLRLVSAMAHILQNYEYVICPWSLPFSLLNILYVR
jgi:hypothetical protein